MGTYAALTRVLDANLAELLDLRVELHDDLLARIYCDVLIHYLQCDLGALNEDLVEIESPNGTSAQTRDWLLKVTKIRIAIRKRDIPEDLLEGCSSMDLPSDALRGELHFVLGVAYETLEKNVEAKFHYIKSSHLLHEAGCKRKSVKAFLNSVVAESRIHPERKLLAEWLHVARKANQLGEFGVAGTALLNISREYQKLGAFEVGLKYCDDSLRLLESDQGSLNYFLALAHRCHLLRDLNRDQEASIEFQRATLCSFPEVHGALAVIEGKTPGNHLTPTWKERVNEKTRPQSLTRSEQALLDLLAQGAKDRFELIERLYGSATAIESSENRLKVLLSRLKKKLPGLIVLEGSRYRVSDDVFVPSSRDSAS